MVIKLDVGIVFTWLTIPCLGQKNFVTRMLTPDLFTVDNLV